MLLMNRVEAMRNKFGATIIVVDDDEKSLRDYDVRDYVQVDDSIVDLSDRALLIQDFVVVREEKEEKARQHLLEDQKLVNIITKDTQLNHSLLSAHILSHLSYEILPEPMTPDHILMHLDKSYRNKNGLPLPLLAILSGDKSLFVDWNESDSMFMDDFMEYVKVNGYFDIDDISSDKLNQVYKDYENQIHRA